MFFSFLLNFAKKDKKIKMEENEICSTGTYRINIVTFSYHKAFGNNVLLPKRTLSSYPHTGGLATLVVHMNNGSKEKYPHNT